MEPGKAILLILLIITALSPLKLFGETDKIFSGHSYSAESHYKYILNNGKIFREENSFRELPIEGNVIGLSSDNFSVYYIKETEDGWVAGKSANHGGESTDFILGMGFSGLRRFICRDNIFYILAEYNPAGNAEGSDTQGELPVDKERILLRFDPDKKEKKIISGVDDFIITCSGLILLTPSGVNCNGVVIPLTVQGERYIDRIIDNRFLFVSNGNEFEIIDTISHRNIYIFREGKAFPYNPDYNIMLEFNDSMNPENRIPDIDNMIYYQVIINGVEAGRTETTPPNAISSSMIKAEAGKFCLIKAERWELDRIKGRYVRVNNIYQPEELKIFVPENRILRIRFNFDGEKYIINQMVYEN